MYIESTTSQLSFSKGHLISDYLSSIQSIKRQKRNRRESVIIVNEDSDNDVCQTPKRTNASNEMPDKVSRINPNDKMDPDESIIILEDDESRG